MMKLYALVFLAAMTFLSPVFNSVSVAEDYSDFPYMNPELSAEERAADLAARLTLDEKISLLTYNAEPIERLGISRYYHGNEALHGIVRPGKFTVFPQAIALAATWDPDLIHSITSAMSDEARARNNEMGRDIKLYSSGLLTFWSPTVNIARDPRWGRTPETYGEDPFLTSRIGVAFVKGLQGDDPKYIKVVSTPKHYVANNEEHNRMSCNPTISERSLREFYLPAFGALIREGGAQSIMSAYNGVNGVPCTASDWLLNKVLRDEWKFDGYVVTDCGAVENLLTRHHYVSSKEEAAAAAINNGVDLECGGAEVMKQYLGVAVEKGLVTEETIHRAAYRVLRGRFRLGMFDPVDMVPYNSISPDVIGSPEHQALALRAGRESIVLLKNEKPDGAPMLPLDRSAVKSIAVLGPVADIARFGDYSGSPVNEAVTPLQGIRSRAGDGISVKHIEWVAPAGGGFITVPAGNMLPEAGAAPGGLKAEYFKNKNLEGEPHITRTDAAVDIDTVNKPPDPAIPPGGFSVRWSGKIIPSVSGEHSLSVVSEGAFRVYMDGELIIKRMPKKRPKQKSGQPLNFEAMQDFENQRVSSAMMMEAGREYDVRLEYVHIQGGAVMKLEWIAPAADLLSARAAEMKLAKESDVVIAVLGIGTDQEREGRDRDNLDLPYGQTEYVRLLMETNPNVVVVLISGSPLAVNWIQDNAPAVVEAWYPGEQGGNAVADVLFGEYNPVGRLPITFHNSAKELPPFDDYEVFNGRTYMYFQGEPLYPFGYGLSYTSFEYSNLSIDKKKTVPGDTITVSVDVKNTGKYSGDEVVQLYAREVAPEVTQPIKRLRGFSRVNLAPGETKTVAIQLPIKTLEYWNEKTAAYKVDPGRYELQIGASSADIKLKEMIEVE